MLNRASLETLREKPVTTSSAPKSVAAAKAELLTATSHALELFDNSSQAEETDVNVNSKSWSSHGGCNRTSARARVVSWGPADRTCALAADTERDATRRASIRDSDDRVLFMSML